MKTCKDCGGKVTERFARVFGDSNDVPHACRGCAMYEELVQGKAAGIEVD